LGFSESAVYAWVKKYRDGGWDALKAKPLPGPASAMTPEMRARLAGMLKRGPREFGFRPALWTRGLVRQLIQKEFGIALSEVRVGQILREMNFSLQRPVHKAVQQDPEATCKWREEEYPKIRAEAEEAGATVYFGDEAGVRADHHAGTTWAPVGRRRSSNRRASGTPWAWSRRSARTGTSISMSTGGRLRLFFLPTYSPELNPDELVWKNVKHDQIGKSGLLRGDDLFDAAWKALENLKKAPEKVKGFFGKPDLAYMF
jgi:transposase